MRLTRILISQGREKILLIEKVTAMGVDVVVSDIDTVW